MRLFGRIIGWTALVLLAGAVLFFWQQPESQVPSQSPQHSRISIPHLVGTASVGLAAVHVQVMYVIPRDRQDLALAGWASAVENVLEEMQAFHKLQFRGQSTLSYEIIPQVIVGERDGDFYDGENTRGGNRHAWDAIREELDRRFGGAEKNQDGAFPVRLILYEGVGALGGNGQILVSSGYLRQTTAEAASIFYHELGHTFGLPDAYEYEHGMPLDEDIMGLGRTKPIGQVYLSEKAKKELGIQ